MVYEVPVTQKMREVLNALFSYEMTLHQPRALTKIKEEALMDREFIPKCATYCKLDANNNFITFVLDIHNGDSFEQTVHSNGLVQRHGHSSGNESRVVLGLFRTDRISAAARAIFRDQVNDLFWVPVERQIVETIREAI